MQFFPCFLNSLTSDVTCRSSASKALRPASISNSLSPMGRFGKSAGVFREKVEKKIRNPSFFVSNSRSLAWFDVHTLFSGMVGIDSLLVFYFRFLSSPSHLICLSPSKRNWCSRICCLNQTLRVINPRAVLSFCAKGGLSLPKGMASIHSLSCSKNFFKDAVRVTILPRSFDHCTHVTSWGHVCGIKMGLGTTPATVNGPLEFRRS